jgi:hypothetical protein
VSEDNRAVRALVVFIVAGVAGCSGAPRRESPPPAEAGAPTTGSPQIERSQPDVKPAGGSGLDAVTRQKLSDDAYIAAIAELEVANATKDASADLAAGHRQVLGIPRPGGSSRFPGMRVAREQLPADVRVVKVAGFIDGTTNRHAMRYGLLVEKYVADYNETMVRAVTR